MKKKKDIELNVDLIGESKPLTKEEKLRISDFIKRNKSKKTAKRKPRKTTT